MSRVTLPGTCRIPLKKKCRVDKVARPPIRNYHPSFLEKVFSGNSVTNRRKKSPRFFSPFSFAATAERERERERERRTLIFVTVHQPVRRRVKRTLASLPVKRMRAREFIAKYACAFERLRSRRVFYEWSCIAYTRCDDRIADRIVYARVVKLSELMSDEFSICYSREIFLNSIYIFFKDLLSPKNYYQKLKKDCFTDRVKGLL